jgi:hypothetical protein
MRMPAQAPTPPGRSQHTPPAQACGALALGALAIGALAIGALAIGRLAIGRLAIGRGSARDVHIRQLTVDDLKIGRISRNR